MIHIVEPESVLDELFTKMWVGENHRSPSIVIDRWNMWKTWTWRCMMAIPHTEHLFICKGDMNNDIEKGNSSHTWA